MVDRSSRLELLKTVETQKEQLQRYEKRLRDVVTAYKGIVKEKEALEASVKVLSAAKSSKEDKAVLDDTGSHDVDSAPSASDSEGSTYQDPLHVKGQIQNEAQNKDDNDQLTSQIETLTSSLCTLTEEKSKLEASYLTDKKRLMQENEDVNKKLEEEKERSAAQIKSLEDQMQEIKSRIRSQQVEHEKEQNNQALMLRELQKLLADERNSKEQLENQLEDTVAVLKEKERLVPNMSEQYEKRIKDLKAELAAVKVCLKTMEEKANEPSPLLISLQTEIAELKAQSRLQVQQEQKRAGEAEQKLKQTSHKSEERVSTLEAKISELSDVVGDYERLRYQDQQTIQKFKERILQLDLENTALARAAHSTCEEGSETEDSLQNLDAQTLANKIVRLKGFLKLANQKAAIPVTIDELLRDEDQPEHNKYKEELEKVKEEFERYKLRAQSVLKNKGSKDNTNSKEMEVLKGQVNDLREKLKTLHVQYDDDMDKTKQRSDSMQKTLVSLQEKHKQELANLQAEHRHQLGEMEVELKKQRERTISMLSEKDREIEVLKAGNAHAIEATYYAQLRNPPDSGASAELPQDVMQSKTEEERAVSRLLKLGHSDANLLFFSQEQARKDVEINSLRKQKHELETALRDLQVSANTREMTLHEEIDNMKESIRKCERDKVREGANLEYLKNVTYKFLTSTDPNAKQQMMNAITTILQFSPQEKTVVHTQFRSWWK